MAEQKKTNNKKQNADIALVVKSVDMGIESAKVVSDTAVSIYVRTLLQNWRQGTVSCKGRSDVSYSNKKPWKQKGTGRARAGSRRSPLWRGGGVIFGPQPRVRELQTTQKTRKAVLGALASQYLDAGNVVCLKWQIQGDMPKTSQAYSVLKESGMVDKKVNLFLSTQDVLTYASFSNIPGVNIFFFDQPNVFDLAQSDSWVFLEKDFDSFKNMVKQWI